ncbi:hypothetical protein ACFW04_000557 [Cataglyphis niger]
MPNLRNDWRNERKRVAVLASKWQNCTANSYYAINRILLLCVGLWPYQNSSFRHIIIALTTVILISSVAVQVLQYFLFSLISSRIPWLAYTLKYNVLCFNIKKMQVLMEQVRRDWNTLSSVQEIEIIKKYWAIGRFITLITILFMYLSIFTFILVQFLSNFLLNMATTANESYSRRLPVKVEYFIDQQKYFIPILLHLFVIVLCGLTTVVATETIHMSYMQHACGLFQIANCRIEQALHKNTIQNVTSSAKRSLIVCQGIISAVNMYRRANKFVEMLRANFKWAYFLLLPLGVLSLSINLYRLSQLIMTEEYYDLIVSILVTIGHFWYMFFCNYVGQEIIDHSGNIFYRTYNTNWYVAPLKAQKLLLLMMQRSIRHFSYIIGGLFIPSFEGFATLTSMSISYFTVIFSTR